MTTEIRASDATSTCEPPPLVVVADYLKSVGLQMDPAAGARRLSGGLANLNFLVRVEGRAMVLRRPPAGKLPKGSHDMAREFRILSRLWRALTCVPRGIHYCENTEVLGVPFQLIEYREGLIIRGTDLPCPDRAHELSEMLISTLARLHAVDPVSVDLDTLGRPDGFLQRTIAGWSARALQSIDLDEDGRIVEEVSDWLSKRRVKDQSSCLLHCDFKLDNCILDPQTLQPNAVIDWDMGTRGPALFDLAIMLSYWVEPNDPPCLQNLGQMPTAHPGFPTRNEMVERYAQVTGHDVSDYPVFRVLAVLKLGVVFCQLHQRWLAGTAGDARYSEFGHLGRALLQYSRSIAEDN